MDKGSRVFLKDGITQDEASEPHKDHKCEELEKGEGGCRQMEIDTHSLDPLFLNAFQL